MSLRETKGLNVVSQPYGVPLNQIKFTAMNTEEQLRHRLAMVEEDLRVIREFIYIQGLSKTFEESTPFSDECWTHLNNIDIACDLNDGESLTWKRFTNFNKETRTL